MPLQDCRLGHGVGRGGRGFGRQGNRGQGFWECGGKQIPDTADFYLMILAVLAEQPRTGLAIIQQLAASRWAGAAASAAEVYPGLMLLEETGLLATTRDEAGRRIYSLTEDGTAELATKRLLANVPDVTCDITTFAGRRHRPRCCRRTAAAIAASVARPTDATPAATSAR